MALVVGDDIIASASSQPECQGTKTTLSLQQALSMHSGPDAKISLQKELNMDAADDEATTDVGQSSASEAESSSGMSSNEGQRRLGRRCRFGITPLETIPGTPSAATSSFGGGSPPGFSRAAMREARDSFCLQKTTAVDLGPQSSAKAVPAACAPVLTGVALSRFGETSFGTVPKTPSAKAEMKSLKSIIGSPPGLSFSERRQERDDCKVAETLALASWGSSEPIATSASSFASGEADLRRAALACLPKERGSLNGLLAKMKEEASRLNSQKPSTSDGTSRTTNSAVGSDGDCEQSTTADKGQPCRFDGTALGTMPKTPAGKEATPPSPPGLSRKAMRQSRDAFMKTAVASTSWGTQASAALTISPSGKPATPVAELAARQRAARDATSLACGGLLPSSLPQASQVSR